MAASKDSDDNTLVITRDFPAPRRRVFEAFSRAEHLDKWIGPIGFTAECTVDFRVGGDYRITMRGHGMVSTVSGEYREIVPDERIVQVMRFDDVPGHDIVQTTTFSERDGVTTLTVRQVFPPWSQVSPEHQALLRPRIAGAPIGWKQSMQHLADLLAR